MLYGLLTMREKVLFNRKRFLNEEVVVVFLFAAYIMIQNSTYFRNKNINKKIPKQSNLAIGMLHIRPLDHVATRLLIQTTPYSVLPATLPVPLLAVLE